jgi:hypothetical protein
MSRPFQLDEHSTLNSLKSIQLFPWNLKPLIWYKLLEGWYRRGLIVHQQRHWPNDGSKGKEFIVGEGCFEYDADFVLYIVVQINT